MNQWANGVDKEPTSRWQQRDGESGKLELGGCCGHGTLALGPIRNTCSPAFPLLLFFQDLRGISERTVGMEEFSDHPYSSSELITGIAGQEWRLARDRVPSRKQNSRLPQPSPKKQFLILRRRVEDMNYRTTHSVSSGKSDTTVGLRCTYVQSIPQRILSTGTDLPPAQTSWTSRLDSGTTRDASRCCIRLSDQAKMFYESIEYLSVQLSTIKHREDVPICLQVAGS